MKAIVLHLMHMREVRGVPLAYVIRQHVKMVQVLPEHDAYLNLDEEMIFRDL